MMTALTADQRPRYSAFEEVTHTASHAVGMVLALGLTVWMVQKAAWYQSAIAVWATAIYGVSMILMYGASTLYHGAYASPFQRVFKLLDHAAIFVMIAGTVTPFALLGLQSGAGNMLLIFVWGVAGFGVAFKIFDFIKNHGDRYRWISLGLYLVLGWSALILIQDLWEALPRPAFFWMLAGGIVYTIGAVIYAIKSIPMGHLIWHVMVVLGSACHAVAVAGYLI